MADNVQLSEGTLDGAVIRTKEKGSFETPVSVIDVGGSGSEALVGDNGVYMPVEGAAGNKETAAGNPVTVGGVYLNDNLSMTSGQAGHLRLDNKQNLRVVIRDADGNDRGLSIGSDGGIIVSGMQSSDFNTGTGTDYATASGILVASSTGAKLVPGDAVKGLKVDLGADNTIVLGNSTSEIGSVSIKDGESIALSAGSANIGSVGLQSGQTVGLDAGTNDIGNVGIKANQSVILAAGESSVGTVGIEAGTESIGTVGLDAGSNAIGSVKVTDSGGSVIDSFGGGTQYTEGDTDTTITGTAFMMEDAANTLRAVTGSTAHGIDVDVSRVQGVVNVNVDQLNDVQVDVSSGNSGSGTQRVAIATDDVNLSALSGAIYQEDSEADANPVGGASILVREDTPSSIATDGDYVAARGTKYGAAYTQIVSSTGAFVDTFGGGQQYQEDNAVGTSGTGTLMVGVRTDSLATLTAAAGDAVGARVNSKGALWTAIDGSVSVGSVSGTVTVSGSVNVEPGSGTLNVSADSLPLPSGAATETSLQTISDCVNGDNLKVEVSSIAASTTAIGKVYLTTTGSDIVSSFGGGVQYSVGDSVVTGTAAMMADSSGNAIRLFGDSTNGQKVQVTNDVSIDGEVTVTGSVGLLSGTNQIGTVKVTDSGGSIVDNFGAGVQYTEGDNDSTITGTAIMFEDDNIIKTVKGSDANGLEVDVTRIQGTVNTDLDSINGNTIDVSSGNKSTGTQRVTIATDDTNLSALTGALYAEDSAADSNPVGNASILVRDDTPVSIATDGDYLAQRGTKYGAAYMQIVNSSGAFVDTFGGGQQYAENSAIGTGGTGTLMIGIRDDELVAMSVAEGDAAGARLNSRGALWTAIDGDVTVSGITDDVTVTGSVNIEPGTGTIAISADLLPLPTGAASESTLNDIAQCVNGNRLDVSSQLQAGTANIGSVAIQAGQTVGLASGSANIGAVSLQSGQTVGLASGSQSIGTVGLNAGSASIGTVGLNAGTNAIGTVKVTTDAGTVIDDFSGGQQYQENENVGVSGTGTLLVGVRTDTLADVAAAASDAVGARMNKRGALWTAIDGSVAVSGITDDVNVTGSVTIEPGDADIGVSATSLPLPTGAASEATLQTISGCVTDQKVQADIASIAAGDNTIGKVYITTDGTTSLTSVGSVPYASGEDVGKATVAATVDGSGNAAYLKSDNQGSVYVSVASIAGSAVLGTDLRDSAGNKLTTTNHGVDDAIKSLDVTLQNTSIAVTGNVGVTGSVSLEEGTEAIGTVKVTDSEGNVIDDFSAITEVSEGDQAGSGVLSFGELATALPSSLSSDEAIADGDAIPLRVDDKGRLYVVTEQGSLSFGAAAADSTTQRVVIASNDVNASQIKTNTGFVASATTALGKNQTAPTKSVAISGSDYATGADNPKSNTLKVDENGKISVAGLDTVTTVTSLSQFNGQTIDLGKADAGDGTLRVAIASDDVNLSEIASAIDTTEDRMKVDVKAIQAGTNLIGKIQVVDNSSNVISDFGSNTQYTTGSTVENGDVVGTSIMGAYSETSDGVTTTYVKAISSTNTGQLEVHLSDTVGVSGTVNLGSTDTGYLKGISDAVDDQRGMKSYLGEAIPEGGNLIGQIQVVDGSQSPAVISDFGGAQYVAKVAAYDTDEDKTPIAEGNLLVGTVQANLEVLGDGYEGKTAYAKMDNQGALYVKPVNIYDLNEGNAGDNTLRVAIADDDTNASVIKSNTGIISDAVKGVSEEDTAENPILDKGVLIHGVYTESETTKTRKNLATDANGELQVGVTTSIPEGTNEIGRVKLSAGSGGIDTNKESGISGNTVKEVVDASNACVLHGIAAFNNTYDPLYLKLYSGTGAVSPGSSTAFMTFCIPGNGQGSGAGFIWNNDIGVSMQGLRYWVSKSPQDTGTDSDSGPDAAGDVIVNVLYKDVS